MLETAWANLLSSLAGSDAAGVQEAIFDLGAISNDVDEIPDFVVERLLTLLRNERMYTSELAGHVLNFFEFEASHSTDRRKWLVIGFLNAHGDRFGHFHSQQVVAELREGKYLQLKKENRSR